MRTYRIPNEVSTEIKFSKAIYLFDFLFLLGLVVLRFMTLKYVHSDFHVMYTLFLVAFGVSMIIRPRTNPKKRMYHALFFAVVRKKSTYSSIDYNESDGVN